MVLITGTVHNKDFCGCNAGVVSPIRRCLVLRFPRSCFPVQCMSPKRPGNELSGLINSSSIKIKAVTLAGSSFHPITLIQSVLSQ